MTSDKFHRAARDGYLDLLRDATRKDCNAPDEDGMTPTLLAATCGNLDALRLLVGRGGDPDKWDHFGNTALHLASGSGHMNCVSFLVNFGVNLWSMDNDHHTAKDIAGIKGHHDILRFLDVEIGKQSALNKKHVQNLKEKAVKDAEKRIKEYEKLQKKATKKAEKEEKRLIKERLKMSTSVPLDNGNGVAGEHGGPPRGPRSSSILPQTLRKDSKALYACSPSYSELLNAGSGTVHKKTLTGVSKKIQKKRETKHADGGGEFKVRETESDGKRSVRSLSGLRRDSEVLYVPKYDSQSGAILSQVPRKHIQDIFDSSAPPDGRGLRRLERSGSEPFLNSASYYYNNHHSQNGNESDSDSISREKPTASLFERPGFGNVAFRQTSISGALMSISQQSGGGDDDSARANSDAGSERKMSESGGDSIGSAGSLAKRSGHRAGVASSESWSGFMLEDEEDDDVVLTSPRSTGLETFLTANDLLPCMSYLRREQVDLQALLLLTETDLKEIGIPMGMRKKMMVAIDNRKRVLNESQEVYDSRL